MRYKQNSKRNDLRGNLSEQCVENLLKRLTKRGVILCFRKATEIEDKYLRTDFILTLMSKREIGLQVKSSVAGVAKFYNMERLYPTERGYAVMPFIAEPSRATITEEKRLAKELRAFDIFLQQQEAVLVFMSLSVRN